MTALSFSFDASTLSWVIAPVPAVMPGPAGSATLVAIPGVALEVDVCDPSAWIGCTVDLEDADPGEVPSFDALVFVAELFGDDVSVAIIQAPQQIPHPTWLPDVDGDESDQARRNRASLGRLAILNELASAERYPSPWWPAEMALAAAGCSPDCGLESRARELSGVGARAYAQLSEPDVDGLDERLRVRLRDLGAALGELVDPALAAEVKAARERLERAVARASLSDAEIGEAVDRLVEELRAMFEADTGVVALRGPVVGEAGAGLVAAGHDDRRGQPAPASAAREERRDDERRYDIVSPFGLPAGGAPLRLTARDSATAVVKPSASLLDVLAPQVAVSLRLLGDRSVVEARFALRERADAGAVARAWARLGVRHADRCTKLVVQSRCRAERGEGVAELALPADVTFDLSLSLSLTDGPTDSSVASFAKRERLAIGQVRRGLADERAGDALPAAARYEDAARRYEDLDDERRHAQALRLAARAWRTAGDDAQAERAAEGAARLSAEGEPAPLGEPFLAEAMRALARRQADIAEDL